MATLDERMTNLETRVNQIDGANLKDAAKAELAQIRREIAGLKQTVRQVSLELQRQLAEAIKAFNEQKTAVQQHLN